MDKITAASNINEIITHEDTIWEIFNRKLVPWRKQFKTFGIDLITDRYWCNFLQNEWVHPSRLKIEDGYAYYCAVSFKEKGKLVMYESIYVVKSGTYIPERNAYVRF